MSDSDRYITEECFVYKDSKLEYVIPNTVLYVAYMVYAIGTLKVYKLQSRQTQVIRGMIKCLIIMQTIYIVVVFCSWLMWEDGYIGKLIKKKLASDQ